MGCSGRTGESPVGLKAVGSVGKRSFVYWASNYDTDTLGG